MAVNMREILSQKEFDTLDDKLKDELVKLSTTLNGKNQMENMRTIVDFYNKNLKNAKTTKAQEQAMFLAITSSLNEKDKKQFMAMYKILQK